MSDSLDDALRRHEADAEFREELRLEASATRDRMEAEVIARLRDFLKRARTRGLKPPDELQIGRGRKAKTYRVWTLRCTSTRTGTPQILWLSPDGNIATLVVDHRGRPETKWLPLEDSIKHFHIASSGAVGQLPISTLAPAAAKGYVEFIELEALEDSLVKSLLSHHG